MDIRNFLDHHGITDNPFGAEEARHDPVFERLAKRDGRAHPELVKILGNVDRPQSSVVFGEKGAGKTALRLMMARDIARHNEEAPDRRMLVVAYDDFNPILDVVARHRARGPRASRDPAASWTTRTRSSASPSRGWSTRCSGSAGTASR